MFLWGQLHHLFALQIDQRPSAGCRNQVLFIERQRNHSPPRTPGWIGESEILGTVWTSPRKGSYNSATWHFKHCQPRKGYVINNCIFKKKKKRQICCNILHMTMPDMTTSRELRKVIAVVHSVCWEIIAESIMGAGIDSWISYWAKNRPQLPFSNGKQSPTTSKRLLGFSKP